MALTELDRQINADWAKVQDAVKANAQRLYWQTRLLNGQHVPTRRLMSLALQAIEDFRHAGDNLPRTEMAKFVEASEKFLTIQRGRIWALAAAEEAQR